MKTSIFSFAAAIVLVASTAPGCAPRDGSKPTSDSGSATRIGTDKSLPEAANAELTQILSAIAKKSGGQTSVVATHVETGQTAAILGDAELPLFSVFKLPVAVCVLQDVEKNRLRLDQKVKITSDEVVAGWQGNTDLWRKPVELTIAELLELSIARSDNTSTDKLLALVGGPLVVTERMRTLGFANINVRVSIREFIANRLTHNTGSAADLARLLTRLQRGEILQAPQRSVLFGVMEHAMTGMQRLRGKLPPGTTVADKTGTGDAGSATNDVGLITLPDGKGHVAIAVLISGSTLSVEEQEGVIADLARAVYDAYVSRHV